MATVELSNGKYAVIDDDDLPIVSGHRWRAQKGRHTFYAATDAKDSDGRRFTLLMHRLLLDAPKGIEVDHRDGNGLDNRRSNIRLATRSENARNMASRPRKVAPYRGLKYIARVRRWYAHITVAGQYHSLGGYGTPEEAARAYDDAARRMHGPFARLNFPDSDVGNLGGASTFPGTAD